MDFAWRWLAREGCREHCLLPSNRFNIEIQFSRLRMSERQIAMRKTIFLFPVLILLAGFLPAFSSPAPPQPAKEPPKLPERGQESKSRATKGTASKFITREIRS
jgi:hypothetical protein